ncbi:MAG: coiled-coil domain-containing protein [bacterium]
MRKLSSEDLNLLMFGLFFLISTVITFLISVIYFILTDSFNIPIFIASAFFLIMSSALIICTYFEDKEGFINTVLQYFPSKQSEEYKIYILLEDLSKKRDDLEKKFDAIDQSISKLTSEIKSCYCFYFSKNDFSEDESIDLSQEDIESLALLKAEFNTHTADELHPESKKAAILDKIISQSNMPINESLELREQLKKERDELEKKFNKLQVKISRLQEQKKEFELSKTNQEIKDSSQDILKSIKEDLKKLNFS